MSAARRHIAILVLLASATSLAGCSKTTGNLMTGSDLNTASTAPVSSAALAALGENWKANPSDVNKGLAYADGLEAAGQIHEQLSVYAQLTELHPENGKIAGLYGRKLAASGRTEQAIPVLQRAERDGEKDWRVMSALGSAYDQKGLYRKAREEYRKALLVDPQNLIVLNNLAMSHALEGDLKEAEAELRAADALPDSRSEPRIRQNLALVVGLQGRFDEATQIAQHDLPKKQVDENMAYLKKMLSQPNSWQQVGDGGQG